VKYKVEHPLNSPILSHFLRVFEEEYFILLFGSPVCDHSELLHGLAQKYQENIATVERIQPFLDFQACFVYK
jgi:hypothetical protein